jgi:hypothetical protein
LRPDPAVVLLAAATAAAATAAQARAVTVECGAPAGKGYHPAGGVSFGGPTGWVENELPTVVGPVSLRLEIDGDKAEVADVVTNPGPQAESYRQGGASLAVTYSSPSSVRIDGSYQRGSSDTFVVYGLDGQRQTLVWTHVRAISLNPRASILTASCTVH